MINTIFSKPEVLISCSSLRNLSVDKLVPLSEEKPVFIDENETSLLLRNIRIDILKNAHKTSEQIYSRHPKESIDKLIVNILLSRRYKRGSRANNDPEMILDKVQKRIQNNQPIQLTISLFPCKIPNRLKSAGYSPDLAEIASISRLAEVCIAIKQIYDPGAEIIVLTDGKRFQDIMGFPKTIINQYQLALIKMPTLLGVSQYVKLIDYVDFLKQNLSPAKIKDKTNEYEVLKREYTELIGEKIDLDNPTLFLEKLLRNKGSVEIIQKIIDLFHSLIYSIYIPEIERSIDPDTLTKAIYQDMFSVTHERSDTIALRRKTIEKTWNATVNYVAEIASGRIVKPVEYVFPDSIRCDMHNIPSRLTLYSVDRSTPLTAFHGTGFIDRKNRIGTRFRISLQSEKYRPVFGKLPEINYLNQPMFYAHDSLIDQNWLKKNVIGNIHLR